MFEDCNEWFAFVVASLRISCAQNKLQRVVVLPWSHLQLQRSFPLSRSLGLSRRLFRLPYDFQFGIQHLRSFLWVLAFHVAIRTILSISLTKLWIPCESDAVSLAWSPRRARRCRRHHPLCLLSIPAGLASECEKNAFRSKVKPLLEQIRGKTKNRKAWSWKAS